MFWSKKQKEDLTSHEIKALDYKYNLAASHTHQFQSVTQKKIVESLPNLWYDAEKIGQHPIEKKFIHTFYTILGQVCALQNDTILLTYSSSIAMVVLANYLKKRIMSVSLLEPCFDNIHDILEDMEIPLFALSEELFNEPEKIYQNLSKNVKGDTLFLVDPNNPTGFTLFSYGQKAWREVIRFARDKKKLLILDLCFLPFLVADSSFHMFDLFKLLEESHISYIALGDTGKAWPVQDAKCGIIKTSIDIYEELYEINRAHLLNVSPFILNMLTSYLVDARKTNYKALDVITINREVARRLSGELLEMIDPQAKLSVAWFKIRNKKLTATELQKKILEREVYVLPGTYFYWKHPELGEKYIRVALARDTQMFEEAVAIIHSAINTI